MKVANIIIAHKNADQLYRLINQFDQKLYHNFIHIDRRCNIKEYERVIGHPAVTPIVNRRKLVWAGYGFVAVTLEALDIIRSAKNEKYFYTNLISGMDFPIKPTIDLYDFLLKNFENERAEFFEILDLSIWPGLHRYERLHLIEMTIKGRYFAERILNSIIPKREFYYGKLKPFGRSAWFTASIDFVGYALDYCQQNPDYLRFLKTTWSPDEFIFNTLIMNSPFKERIAPHFLRHIDWSEGKVSPRVFTYKDFDMLLETPSYLARKFDCTVDNVIISKLEESNSLRS